MAYQGENIINTSAINSDDFAMFLDCLEDVYKNKASEKNRKSKRINRPESEGITLQKENHLIILNDHLPKFSSFGKDEHIREQHAPSIPRRDIQSKQNSQTSQQINHIRPKTEVVITKRLKRRAPPIPTLPVPNDSANNGNVRNKVVQFSDQSSSKRSSSVSTQSFSEDESYQFQRAESKRKFCENREFLDKYFKEKPEAIHLKPASTPTKSIIKVLKRRLRSVTTGFVSKLKN